MDETPIFKPTMSKRHISRYNPLETLNLNADIDESDIVEAFKDQNFNDLKYKKQDIEFYKYKGFWAWVRGMIVIDDAMMRKACSSDAYIYLLYLKWCAIFLFVLSIIGVLLLCPFYYQGTREEKAATFLQSITVFEIKHSNWRIWTMFFISLTYSVVGYRFVYNLVIKLKDFRDYKEEYDNVDNDYQVSKKVVMIRNIPDFLSVRYVDEKLKKIFSRRYGRDFENVSTLGRYSRLFDLINDRISIASKLNKHMVGLFSSKRKYTFT